ncbi:MAG: hypothetical protein HYS27_01120 [Deltaproteobacteria bacterium]|nr:hypothetical protein [Deltaproteobacteria bacterium]
MHLPAFALLLAAAAVPTVDADELRTGDLLLHTSSSAQALAVAVATRSSFTHVGVVVREGDAVWVVEAAGRARRTPLAEFLRRGRSSSTVLRDARLDDDELRARVQREVLALVGTPYDGAFAEGADELYCSELLVEAWRRAGLPLGVAQQVGDLDVQAPPVRALFAKRWRRHPACRGLADARACLAVVVEQRIVTPAGLADDERLHDLGYLPVPR